MVVPLSQEICRELVARGVESPDVDYKEFFDPESVGDWMELAKDVYAMSNYGGGYIVFGVRDGTFAQVGVNPPLTVDTQMWVDKISRWSSSPVSLNSITFKINVDGEEKSFTILQINPSVGQLITPKVDGRYENNGKPKIVFYNGSIYTRRNTSSAEANGEEFWDLFWALTKRTARIQGSTGTPLQVISTLKEKAKPDRVKETLWTNLFPVKEIPDHIFAISTSYRDALSIYKDIEKAQQETPQESRADVPPFLLKEGKLFSFVPLDQENPLSLVIKGIPEILLTKNWLSDESKHRDLVQMLNYNLKTLCKRRGFVYDMKKDRYYARFNGENIPEVTWKPYARTATRRLIKPAIYNGELKYYEHFGGRLRFALLGAGIYLVIEPTRVLTADGENPLDQQRNVKISTAKSFQYHNNNYLYDLKLWLHVLAGTRQEVHFGPERGRIVVSISPISAEVSFGINNDQHTGEDFLDQLKDEPLEYTLLQEQQEDENPLTMSSLED